MNAPPIPPDPSPGHHGTGYGEHAPEETPGRSVPQTAATPPVDSAGDPAAITGTVGGGGDGAPVVFTPDDVHARPPDHPPTENAPESEKAGLIFERS